jgi:exosome complex component RRP42
MNDNYIKSLIEKGKRIDGRKLEDYRKITLESGISKYAEGSARCKIGETEVLVGVKFDIGEPYSDSPNEGTIIVSAELSPIANPTFELGPPGDQSIELARVVDRGIRESKAIDFKNLCIRPGEKIFMAFIDIHILNDEGNLIDAAVLGAMKALSETRLPKVENDKIVYGEFTSKKLKLDKMPVTCTIYKIGNSLLVDVNSKEEEVVDARLSVNVANGTIHAMQKGGDFGFTIDEIGKAIDIAIKKEKELVKFLK